MGRKSLSIHWLEQVWQAELPSNSKYLCAYLYSFMNPKNHIAWPSLKRIVEETGLSKATVCRHFITLEEAGWLVRDGGSSNKNTVYRAIIPKLLQDEINKIELLDDGKGSFTMRLPDDGGSLTMRQGVSHHETKVVSPRDTNRQRNSQVIANTVRFAAPTLSEAVEYFASKGSTAEQAERFINFYESKGWMVGKTKMQKWKAAASNWINRNQSPAYPVRSGSAAQQENNLRVIQNWRPDDAV